MIGKDNKMTNRSTEKQERVYYEVRFDDYLFSPHYFKTLKEAEDCIKTADNLGSLEDWVARGKESTNWQYWRNVYDNTAYIVQIHEEIYPL